MRGYFLEPLHCPRNPLNEDNLRNSSRPAGRHYPHRCETMRFSAHPRLSRQGRDVSRQCRLCWGVAGLPSSRAVRHGHTTSLSADQGRDPPGHWPHQHPAGVSRRTPWFPCGPGIRHLSHAPDQAFRGGPLPWRGADAHPSQRALAGERSHDLFPQRRAGPRRSVGSRRRNTTRRLPLGKHPVERSAGFRPRDPRGPRDQHRRTAARPWLPRLGLSGSP
jgi:hypothetical protein